MAGLNSNPSIPLSFPRHRRNHSRGGRKLRAFHLPEQPSGLTSGGIVRRRVAGGFHRRVYLLEARARSVSPTFFGEWQLRLDVFDIVLLVFERNIGDFQMLESLVQLFVRNACRRPVIRSGGKCRGFSVADAVLLSVAACGVGLAAIGVVARILKLLLPTISGTSSSRSRDVTSGCDAGCSLCRRSHHK